MSEFKMRFFMCAALLSPIATAHAVPAADIQRAGVVAGTAGLELTAVKGESAMAVVEAPNPWSHKRNKHWPR